MASDFAALLGLSTSHMRVVTERDILTFADISGDHSPNHVDEVFMRSTPYGRRIAHGALIVAFMSRCSTEIVDQCGAVTNRYFPVSLGYDRVRFLKAVLIDDEITLHYVIASVDPVKRRTLAEVTVRNAGGETVAVATHIMSWIAKD